MNNTAHSSNNDKREAGFQLSDEFHKINENKWTIVSPQISRFTINEVDSEK